MSHFYSNKTSSLKASHILRQVCFGFLELPICWLIIVIQILELGSCLNKAPFQLLSPYFKIITPLIVDKLLTSPGILSDVCQLLAVTPRDFLTYTKAPALLAAIKSSNRAIIDQLSVYIERNPGALLLDNAEEYIPDILFMEDEAAARKAMSFVCRTLGEYLRRRTGKNDEMTESRLLNTCAAPLLGELVMHLGSEDSQRREKVSRRSR